MKSHISYLKYVLRHKWFVFCSRKLTGASLWRVLVHDLSKFSPQEWSAYANTFYNSDGSKKKFKNSHSFDLAWNHHLKVNKHHWQYWVMRGDSGSSKAIEMPLEYVKEMIADWIGAGLAISGKNDVYEWYAKNREKMILHPITRVIVDRMIKKFEV